MGCEENKSTCCLADILRKILILQGEQDDTALIEDTYKFIKNNAIICYLEKTHARSKDTIH